MFAIKVKKLAERMSAVLCLPKGKRAKECMGTRWRDGNALHVSCFPTLTRRDVLPLSCESTHSPRSSEWIERTVLKPSRAQFYERPSCCGFYNDVVLSPLQNRRTLASTSRHALASTKASRSRQYPFSYSLVKDT